MGDRMILLFLDLIIASLKDEMLASFFTVFMFFHWTLLLLEMKLPSSIEVEFLVPHRNWSTVYSQLLRHSKLNELSEYLSFVVCMSP